MLAMSAEKLPDNPVPTQHTDHSLNKSYETYESIHDLLGSVDLELH
jgi:hypothetical protein